MPVKVSRSLEGVIRESLFNLERSEDPAHQTQAFGSRLEGLSEGSLTSDQLEAGDGMLELHLFVCTILEGMNTKILSEKQQAMLERLVRLPDKDIDVSDQPEILDWSNAECGKFYRPVKQNQSSQTPKVALRKTRSSSD